MGSRRRPWLRYRPPRPTPERSGLALLGEALADAVADRGELDLGAGHVLQELVGRRLLAERPQLAQQRPGLATREPVVAELLAQVVAQLALECPGAQVRGDVEAGVDVGEVVGLAD